MATLFSYASKNLAGNDTHITLCSGPVIISQDKKILLHISSSTGKYQFIGGRLDTNITLKENALLKAGEVLDAQNISFEDQNPLSIHGEITRNGKTELLVLFHYKARLENEGDTGEAVWKTLEEIEVLQKQDMLSSHNILIAAKYFLNQ